MCGLPPGMKLGSVGYANSTGQPSLSSWDHSLKALDCGDPMPLEEVDTSPAGFQYPATACIVSSIFLGYPRDNAVHDPDLGLK
ncbi:hypothetical protein ACN38_g2945 [Penicillium nordicum]|uniref:Uncharacterized protein n=1 Tax=Penicillium nordicum TaxID=229535 RepID=A0A0M9WIF3_9EURO|nr:hypothetical protein ACN38_g2945 [Penicillium nordicum]